MLPQFRKSVNNMVSIRKKIINPDPDHIINLKICDNNYGEYLFHKLYDHPECEWTEWQPMHPPWDYDNYWRLLYYLVYKLFPNIIKDAHVIDVGSAMGFWSAWAMLNGARSVFALEPDKTRFELGEEHFKLRNLDIQTRNISVEQFKSIPHEWAGKRHSTVVYLFETLVLFNDQLGVLRFLKEKIRPDYLLLVTSTCHNAPARGQREGIITVKKSKTDSASHQSFGNNLALKYIPDRRAIDQLIKASGWKVHAYYDFNDLRVGGRSKLLKNMDNKNARQGRKMFYILV